MARAYSEDLREKVISYIMSGGSKREAARTFNIGEDTIYRWMRRHKAGDIRPKIRTDYPRKIDEQKLKDYVEANPDHTLEQIGRGLNLGRQTIFRWLRRLKITRKKRQPSTKNGMKTRGMSLKSTSRK